MRRAARKGGRRAARARGLGDLLQADVEPLQPPLVGRLLRALPSSPRCGICGAPFSGFGSRLVRPLGYRPSRKNPTLCDDLRRGVAAGRDDDRGRRPLRRSARLHPALRAVRPGGGQRPPAPLLLLRRGRPLPRGGDRQADRRRGDGALPADVRGAATTPRRRCWPRPTSCSAGSATAAPRAPSSRSGSASTTARPSSATSASARSTTSPRSATWSTSRRDCRARRRAARSSPPGASSSNSSEPPGERIEVELKGKAEPVVAYRSVAAV